MFLSGQDIYDNFTGSRGTAEMVSSADVVEEVVTAYNQRGDQIKSLLGKMDGVWKGDAAGAAHRGVGPLAVEHALAAPTMDGMRDLVQRQAGSFNDAKHAVVKVPPAPTAVDPLAEFLRPGEFVTYQQKLSAHNTATQHNVDVMRGYEGASTYNMNMPHTFGSITADQAEIRVAQPATAPPPPQSPGGRPSPQKSTQDVRPTGGIGGRPDVEAPGVNTPGERHGNNGPLPPPAQPSPLPPGTTPGGYKPPPPGLGTSTGIGTGMGPGTGVAGPGSLDTAVGTGGVPAVGVKSSERGGVPGARTSAPGTSGPGSRPGIGPVGSPGSSMGPVNGPGATTETPAARNAPVGRSTASGAPMGAVPANRSQNADDEERRRASFLEEPDPEAVFGLDQPTAPPVIGA